MYSWLEFFRRFFKFIALGIGESFGKNKSLAHGRR